VWDVEGRWMDGREVDRVLESKTAVQVVPGRVRHAYHALPLGGSWVNHLEVACQSSADLRDNVAGRRASRASRWSMRLDHTPCRSDRINTPATPVPCPMGKRTSEVRRLSANNADCE
jgi:hypothetical protein